MSDLVWLTGEQVERPRSFSPKPRRALRRWSLNAERNLFLGTDREAKCALPYESHKMPCNQ